MNSEYSCISIGRFVISGASAALLNLCLLWLLTRQMRLWYVSASGISYSICVGYNFLLQRVWTFNNMRGSMIRQFAPFAATNLFGLMLNTAMLFALVHLFGLPLILSQAVASLALAILSFLIYRRIFSY